MKRLGFVVIVIAVAVGLFAASVYAKGGPQKLAIAQTVSGGNDNVTLSGSNFPPETNVAWTIEFCQKVGGGITNCSVAATGTSPVDALGNFDSASATWPCGSAENVVLANANDAPAGVLNYTKKMAC